MWKFNPIYKQTIWGGHRIASLRGLAAADRIGECWWLSCVPGSLSTVDGGPDDGLTIIDLIERDGPLLLGKLNHQKFGSTFPLLVKLIDADDNLSVQVHPDDEMAASLGAERGKTEMWYALNSAPDACLSVGFNSDVDPAEFVGMVQSGRVVDLLNVHNIAEGDVFFIPAGTIHTIGRGCFLIEIQQTSDDTYRIFDYDRRDHSGRPRDLHLDLACRALNFDRSDGTPVKYADIADIPVNVVRSPYFTTNVMTIDCQTLRDYSECDSFVVVIAAKGAATLSAASGQTTIREGELALVPASADNITIDPEGNFRALEVYIKQ